MLNCGWDKYVCRKINQFNILDTVQKEFDDLYLKMCMQIK